MTGLFSSSVIPPIVCKECGNLAHLVRRAPYGKGEIRTFECAECDKQYMRSTDGEESDEQIQKTMERILGRGR